jgi:prevent-host-death family protein
MKIVTLTEFRKNASSMLTQVEHGEILCVLRHGRPIAEVSPVTDRNNMQPSWKKPALRLSVKGVKLSSAIREERECEGVS